MLSLLHPLFIHQQLFRQMWDATGLILNYQLHAVFMMWALGGGPWCSAWSRYLKNNAMEANHSCAGTALILVRLLGRAKGLILFWFWRLANSIEKVLGNYNGTSRKKFYVLEIWHLIKTNKRNEFVYEVPISNRNIFWELQFFWG